MTERVEKLKYLNTLKFNIGNKMSRAKILKKPMKVISFKIDDELLTVLDLYAINKRASRSEIIREAIFEFLNKKR